MRDDAKVLLRRVAESDLEDAFAWYQTVNQTLSEKFLDGFERASTKIAEHPRLYPIFLGRCRRLHLKVYPYFVYFTVERRAVVIHAVLHTSRNPALHRSRAQ